MNGSVKYDFLSSVSRELGFSPRFLYSLSNTIRKHYREVELAKRDGGTRTLSVPDDKLKAVQRRIADVLLPLVPVSPYASAYVKGSDVIKNASPHVGAPVVLKLDVSKFFDSIFFPQVKDKAFPAQLYPDRVRILLTILCMYKEALPQGSPASPGISNIIMRDFDDTVGEYCKARGIAYTRYCDDMTFSGDFDPEPVKRFVRGELRRMGFFLNEKKTVVLKDGQRKQICGIVVNEKVSLPRDYRDGIRRDIYYCKKYGVEGHLERTGQNTDPLLYLRSLSGRINYAKSVYSRRLTPNDEKFHGTLSEYHSWVGEQIRMITKEPQ